MTTFCRLYNPLLDWLLGKFLACQNVALEKTKKKTSVCVCVTIVKKKLSFFKSFSRRH